MLILVSALWFSEDSIPCIGHWKELPLTPALLYLYLHLPLPRPIPLPEPLSPLSLGDKLFSHRIFAWNVFIAETPLFLPTSSPSWLHYKVPVISLQKKKNSVECQESKPRFSLSWWAIHAVVTGFSREEPKKVDSFYWIFVYEGNIQRFLHRIFVSVVTGNFVVLVCVSNFPLFFFYYLFLWIQTSFIFLLKYFCNPLFQSINTQKSICNALILHFSFKSSCVFLVFSPVGFGPLASWSVLSFTLM